MPSEPSLFDDAPAAASGASAAPFVPRDASLAGLRIAAGACRGCHLYEAATQTVFGEGPADAPVMFVGEQPGDAEDLAGRPFVGPAGKLLRNALRQAGFDDERVYITNAVKHFKFIERGKRRIHATPKRFEITACAPWLESEIRAVDPLLVVALGATAAQALLGSAFRLTRQRGERLASPLAPNVIATVHPSSILRAVDAEARTAQEAAFIDDLRIAAAALDELIRA